MDINLADNTNLRSVSMHKHFKVLSNIYVPQLSHILFRLTIRYIADLKAFDRASLEYILIQQRWTNIQILTIHVHCKEVIPAATESIKARLLTLEDRGVLDVVQGM